MSETQAKSEDENYEFEGEHNAKGKPHGYAVAIGKPGSAAASCLREGMWAHGKMRGIGVSHGGLLEGEFGDDSLFGYIHGHGAFHFPDGKIVAKVTSTATVHSPFQTASASSMAHGSTASRCTARRSSPTARSIARSSTASTSSAKTGGSPSAGRPSALSAARRRRPLGGGA